MAGNPISDLRKFLQINLLFNCFISTKPFTIINLQQNLKVNCVGYLLL